MNDRPPRLLEHAERDQAGEQPPPLTNEPLSRGKAPEGQRSGPLRPGDLLSGRFVIERLANLGGMGAVYRAHERTTEAPIAIKVMWRESARNVQRFAREAAILSSLHHDAIVRYESHGMTDGGAPYVAMEWLEGEDLSERLRRGPLTVEESVTLLRRICEGLSVAHGRGIVHRDIKPSNLFLVEGRPDAAKLLDFGISRGDQPEPPLTRDGDLLGTVGYMAPEQAMGRTDVDARADVFSLGSVFYECLTGRPPFESTRLVAVLAKVLREEPPPPSDLRPGLPRSFNRLTARALAKQPALRPADAAALSAELDDLLAGGQPSERPLARMAADTEQRIVSVILGKQGDGRSDHARRLTRDLDQLAQQFSVDISPLRGGALLLLLSGRGEANDRARLAASCALTLHGLQPGLRLAVATGLAETHPVPIGAAIDRAAELLDQSAAKEPAVWIDDLTADLIGRSFELQRRPGCSMLLGARAELTASRKLMGKPIPCVGRELELRLLDTAYQSCVADAAARVLLVTGPPGIGKSRLASEWLDAGEKRDEARILVARADPMTSSSSLSLVQHLLRSAIGAAASEPAEVQRGRLTERLRPLLEDGGAATIMEFLEEVLSVPRDAPPSPMLRAARSTPEIMHEQVRRALDAWIAAETATRPVIMVLEDLHWGDEASVSFLHEAVRRHENRPLLLLILARPEVEQRFPLTHQSASLSLRLPGLSPRAAERLIRAALDPAPSDEVIAGVVRTADGNAFYLEELLRSIAAGSAELPESVLAMVQSRLEHLDAVARYVLRAASVFGEACWAEGVACIVDPSIDCASVLDQLAAREILVRAPSARYGRVREYRFRHALLRDAAYGMLTSTDRRAAHRAAAAWLTRIGEKEARLLAEHYISGDAPALAVPWLVRATRSAIDHGDLKGTIALADRGLALGAQGIDRGRLLLARGHAETWSGHDDAQRLREALELLPHGGAEWWLALALLTLAESASGRVQQAVTCVGLALRAPPSSEQVGSAGQALLTLVGALVLLGRGELAATLLERVASLPARGDDPVFGAFLNLARCALASVAPIGGRWHLEYAFHAGWEGVESMQTIGAVCGEAMALNYFAVAATHLGRYAEAKRACLRSRTLAEHVGSGLNRDWAGIFLAKAQVRLDDPEGALATLETLRSSVDANLQQMLPAIAGEARFRQGRFEQAIADAEVAVGGPSPRLRRMAGYLRARAFLALARPDDALHAIDQALTEPTTTGLESEIDLFAVRAEALLATGDERAAKDAARTAYQQVRAIADTIADLELRRSFLEDVDACARTLRLSHQLSVDHAPTT